MAQRIGAAAAGLLLLLPLAAGANDDGPPPTLLDWSVPGQSFTVADSLLTVPVDIYGAAYASREPAGASRDGLTAAALVQPEIEHNFDNGWNLGVKTSFLVHHDRLAGDNYGDRFVEKAYVYLQTAYGRLEAGQADGAAYSLEVTGPLVAGPPAIDDANVTFFIDPSTKKAFTNIFSVRTGVFASANNAKISYYSPRLVELQVGISFTPGETKGVPFFSHAEHAPNHQHDIIEAGANYVHGWNKWILHAYAGIAHGNIDDRTPQHRGLLDWAIGAQLDYKLPHGALLAFGGAYRESRGYTFDPDQSFSHGNTNAIHATARYSNGAWQVGFEYSNGIAGRVPGMPQLTIKGYEPSVSCAVTSNLQLVGGYQHLDYGRSDGTFFNGKRDVTLDAGFLYFEVKV